MAEKEENRIIRQNFREILKGAGDSVPIMIGYGAVSMAFGAACISAGLAIWQATIMSLLVYSGATQLILLAMIQSGAPVLPIILLCSLMSLRHLLYGPLIARLFPESRWKRILMATGLTDEVFAVALTKLNRPEFNPEKDKSVGWYGGLAFLSYFSWVVGTFAGACLGTALEHYSPETAAAMQFAFPAMFFALTLQCLSAKIRIPVAGAVLFAGILSALNYPTMAILAGAVIGVLLYRPSERISEPEK